jgi:hypothetical protein
MDPFLSNTRFLGQSTSRSTPKSLLAGVKRKRPEVDETPANKSGVSLVDYDSD